MAPEKDHCDLCGKTLSPRDFEKGRAIILLRKAWCRSCAQKMVEKSKEKPSLKPASRTHRSRATTKAKVTAPSPAGSGVRQGDHACYVYSSEEERALQLARFLSEGLRHHEKVVYAVDEGSPERVLGYLAHEGLSADRYLESGQLEIHSTQNIYAPGGAFDPTPMIARIKMLCDQVAKEGYSGLRGTGEMSWALRGWPGSEKLIEYELRVNAAIAGGRWAALCQYDSSKFSAALLHQIKAAHSVALPAAAR
jgi:ribosome-binding protein aMBF1 (putative translation factor)